MISPRSKLYRLAPIGVGSPHVESLSSYFRRLASAHCVSPAHLFEQSMAPLMGKRYLTEGSFRKWHSFLGASYRHFAINGVGSTASDWIRCLEELTLRENLRGLTMIGWSNIVSSQQLFHDRPGWCSSCFNDWRESGQELRELLLWTLRPVQICDLHQRRLSFRCCHCRVAPRPLCISSKPGYCSHCGEWLGALGSNEDLEGLNSNWQRWVTRNVGQMLSIAPAVSDKPVRTKIAMSMTHLIAELCNGNSAAFAHQIGRLKNTVWGWLNLGHRIRISDLLAVCYWAQVSPSDLLLSDRGSHHTQAALFSDSRPSPPREAEKQTRVIRRLDKEQIEAQLEALLASGSVPTSWREIAAIINVDRVHLRRLFPELSRLLVAECKKARAISKADRDLVRRMDIHSAIAEAQRRGLSVSRRIIVSILKEQGKVADYVLIATMLRNDRSVALFGSSG